MFRKTIPFQLISIIVFFSFLIINITNAQVVKTAPAVKPIVKPVAKILPKPGSVKGVLTADMDCVVKVNGNPKLLNAKTKIPLAIVLNVGENKIEATSAETKSTFKSTVIGEFGIQAKVLVSFFDDDQFLDYIKQGNIQMVEAVIKKNPTVASNKAETLISSPLEVAIQNSQVDIVKLLLNNGANFNSPSQIFPLHKAVLYTSSAKSAKDKPAKDIELVDLFLSKGCKLTDKDDGGNTPLHCAVRAIKLDMVNYLVEKGADVNAVNDFGDSPLKIANDKGAISIMTYLTSKGAVEK
jgi:hypothetical protein